MYYFSLDFMSRIDFLALKKKQSFSEEMNSKVLRELCSEARQRVWKTQANHIFVLNGKELRKQTEKKSVNHAPNTPNINVLSDSAANSSQPGFIHKPVVLGQQDLNVPSNLSHTIIFNPNDTTQTKNLNNTPNNQNISLDNLLKNFDTSSALFKDNSGFQVNDYGSFEDNSGSFE